jgi:hypothetical protein
MKFYQKGGGQKQQGGSVFGKAWKQYKGKTRQW